jgi:N-ethylmaleimide reductase
VQAGFDGVEIHGANGYLPIQFLSTNLNLRDDEFGGSVERRVHFCTALVDAVSEVRGPGYIGYKISPGSTAQGVFDADPLATYAHLARELSKRGIAYLHLQGGTLDWDVFATLRPLFDGPLIAVRALTRPRAAQMIAEGLTDLAAWGQLFLSNPDLVDRFRNGWALNEPHLNTYYSQGETGYNDYPIYAHGDPTTMLPPDEPYMRRG